MRSYRGRRVRGEDADVVGTGQVRSASGISRAAWNSSGMTARSCRSAVAVEDRGLVVGTGEVIRGEARGDLVDRGTPSRPGTPGAVVD